MIPGTSVSAPNSYYVNGLEIKTGGLVGPTGVDAGKIQGVAVSVTAPTPNYVLTYNGSAWAPAPAVGGGSNCIATATTNVCANVNDVTMDLTGTQSFFMSNSSNVIKLGYNALSVNVGVDNMGIGRNALQFNTTGIQNIAIGPNALQSNTIGQNCIAIGQDALATNSTSENIAIGYRALYNNTGPIGDNIGIGVDALFNNSGYNNIAIGRDTLLICSGNNNIGMGGYTLHNCTGSNNTAVGFESQLANTTGSSNTSLGMYSLKNNTSISNTGIGAFSLRENTTGMENTGVGVLAGGTNSTGSSNTSIGAYSFVNSSGSNNTGVGHGSGYNSQTGNDNIIIGSGADCNVGNTNVLIIGRGVIGFTDNEIIIGRTTNFQVTFGHGAVIIPEAADNAAAATLGVRIGGLYRLPGDPAIVAMRTV